MKCCRLPSFPATTMSRRSQRRASRRPEQHTYEGSHSSFLGVHRGSRFGGLFGMFLDQLVPHRPHLQETFRFLVKALSLSAVKRSFAENAKHSFRPEVVFVVETVDCPENVIRGKPRILNVR